MSIKLGQNTIALSVQRELNSLTGQVQQTSERLSSGLRINRASDDAAGLAVSLTLNADRRIFQRGIQNLNDGISLLNIADGAANELGGILTRIRELTEQSANGVYSNQQRVALGNESDALVDEYNRIVESTEFNGNEYSMMTGRIFRFKVATAPLILSSQPSLAKRWEMAPFKQLLPLQFQVHPRQWMLETSITTELSISYQPVQTTKYSSS